MSNRTLKEWIESQDDGGRVFAEEQLIAATTEDIWARMQDKSVSKAELAGALKRSKAYVSQLLSGTRNMTLRTLADVAHALDCTVKVDFCERKADEGWQSLAFDTAAQTRPSMPPCVSVRIVSSDGRIVDAQPYARQEAA
jgi:transcriptional regulator with XRE-family HTH domain